MKKVMRRIQIFSISVVALILLGLIPQAVWAAESIQYNEEQIEPQFEGYDLDSIYIFYDSTNEMMEAIAKGVEEIAGFRINSITLIPVMSVRDIEYYLYDDPWIAIYSFNTTLTTIKFPDRELTWRQFYQIMKSYQSTQHVVGTGNTFSLDSFLAPTDDMIHHSESEQADALILMLYDVWAIREIALKRANEKQYKYASEDLEKMVLSIWADNFDMFFHRTVEPVDTVGEFDVAAAEERRIAMWAAHPPEIEKAAYTLTEEGKLEEVPLDDLPEDFSPVIKLSSEAELSADDFILGEIPLLSGLRGPIGEIVDVLLNLLGSGGSSILSVPSDAMNAVKDVFEFIKPFIGVVESFDAESPLKSLILGLIKEFPFPEDLKKYLEPIVKALFNLRGNLDSIVDVIGEIIKGLLPAIIPEDVLNFLDVVLDLGSGLWDLISDVITDGKGVFDTVLSFMVNNVLKAFLNKTLVATLGLDAGSIGDLLTRGIAFIESVVDYLASFNFQQFIKDVGEKLLQAGLGLLTDTVGEGIISKIMSLLEIGMSVVSLIDNFDAESLITLVSRVADEFLGGDIAGTAEDLARRVMQIVQHFSENGLPDLNDFRSQIEAVLNDPAYVLPGAAQNVKDLIRDAVTLVAGFFNDGFDDSQIPDLFDIIENLVTIFGHESGHYTLAQTSEILEAVASAVKPIMGLVALIMDNDALKKLVSRTVNNFLSELGNLPQIISNVLQFLDSGDLLSGASSSILETFGNIVSGIMSLIGLVRGQSFEGIMQALLMSVGSIVGIFPAFDGVPIDAFLKLLQSFFPKAFGLDTDNLPSVSSVISDILDMASGFLPAWFDASIVGDILGFLMNIKGIFTDGIKWLLGMAYDWLTGQLTPLLKQLEDMINGILGGDNDLLGFSGKLPIGLGDWNLFELKYALGIKANFALNPTPFFELIRSVLFEGRAVFSLDTLGDFFKTIFSFFEISPQFYAELGVEGLDTSKNAFMAFLLGFLGVDLSFTGYAKFVLNLFTFREGQFEWEEFFKVVEWQLTIKIAIQRTLTLLDFLTGGVGGGLLNKIMEFLGLDSISVDIWFSIELDIVKKAASATNPEVSSLTLILTLGCALNIPINLLIVEITFRGSLEIILSFYQDFASPAPMQILLRLILTFKLKLRFLFWDWEGEWTWEPGGPWDLSPSKGEPEYENSGVGFDSDGDGLGDEYESTIPGLDLNNPDTDGDGANDKLEVQTMGTDPVNPDSDGDGLLDGEEWELGTNPMRPDSDWDDVNDYDEVKIYATDPLQQDTDGDGLSDAYEIRTPLNISCVTPTVTEVVIGGTSYNDHTDPLNPDTDGDGLVDGDEGPMGAFYGNPNLYNDTEETEGGGDWVMDPDPLIFYDGYTHPLDADTDDDSALQLYNGMVDYQAYLFLKDMNDGAEVAGFWIIKYDEEGEPENVQVFTNPCNPDTDGDTGITDRTPQPGAWLNSDGYELAQTPPTDPTDGDSDDDGLLDGLEGVLNQWSNHTNPNDPDTDDDGLFDMQEMLLGCDPRCQDTDGDMISDGDEFYTFFTSPYMWDSDLDGLGDGEEVYIWHSNPMLDDSDGDSLYDSDEVLYYGSDPMDEDTDNDGLTDFEEVFVYYTDTFDYDTDDDGLSDGEEILVWDTDPLDWDTDEDTISEPNADGEMTWPMSDYDEVMIHGTNATDPDSDLDGLSDSIELYLGSGEIPWMDPLPLNPLDNDTDHDLIADGSELLLQNVSDIVYPYRAITIVFRYNSSPVLQDTDNDTLIDYQEIMVFNSNPSNNDTDNDTLTDYMEIWVYNTSALFNDTDGDGLWDFEETLTEVYPYGPWPPDNWSIGMGREWNATLAWERPDYLNKVDSWPSVAGGWQLAQEGAIYPTSATDPDSDDDWLSDGGEVYFYETNPMNSDSDSDGVPDTLEFDTDFDGLPDGIENKERLFELPGGGILNPDSDKDGLTDGDEYYIYGTDPGDMDTDDDGYSDGIEIIVGTDPLKYTSKEEFEMFLAEKRGSGTLQIMTPQNLGVAAPNTAVVVANFTTFQEMWFRFSNGSGWSANYSLEYNSAARNWYSNEVEWADGNYTLQVFARNNSGIVHAAQITFIVQTGAIPSDMLFLILIAAGIGIAGFVVIGSVFLIRKRRKGESPKKEAKPKKEKKSKKKEKKSDEAKSEKTSKKSKDTDSKGKKGGA
jgi:hypothetical protein